ncbi:GH32 C-terminal domain-containing protein [Lactiplantibacillus argentoratensis]|uniref:GH32 C-terminal domain-containing protein n=1 Tax=Lactiplantibacillus argentoratensis TaxID=271881 RepID=UPI001BDD172F|nr:GH32 C-terminal domain-containing protein [Lactiplantibacillus argentoratensis]MBT1145068.1 GH32 C-terminal domain-containing protein [Lactiplantibacillus argentoratensis]MBT1147916.1 GH32 C-terminal domain-containing protein [Lactiplantibacillus argentoratensis]MBT1150797.1 GH32 C-terminal domain-containing protein [Lactiplantibacillus argentoratensis]
MKINEKQHYKMYKSKGMWVFACLSTCLTVSFFNGGKNVSAATSAASSQISQSNTQTSDATTDESVTQSSSVNGVATEASSKQVALPSSSDSEASSKQVALPSSSDSKASSKQVALPSSSDSEASSKQVALPSSSDSKASSKQVALPSSSDSEASSSNTVSQTDDDKNQVASNSTNNTDVTKHVTTSDSDKAIVNSNTTSPTSDEQAKSSLGQSQTDQSTSSTTIATKATTTVAVDNSAKATTPDISQNDQYDEQYRNQFHYSSNENWINDPNGLFYDSSTGLYNLYYQYNPKGNQWGNMSWGHAVSKDLINWTQEDVAIPMLQNQGWEDFTYTNTTGSLKDKGEVRYVGVPTTNWGDADGKKAIFSGSIVVDTNNVSGLGKDAILAFYTADYQIATRKNDGAEDGWGTWIGLTEIQEQHLAYSLDGGKTFIQYSKDGNAANPQAIIPTSMNQGGDSANFRDPSVVYDAVNKQYYLTVVSGQQALIYKSSNLLDWTYASKIERENDVGNGVWECPSLVPMKVAGTNETKWVFCISVQQGAHATGSGMQYYVGNMTADGTWVPESSKTLQNPMTMDSGEDFYAGIPFSNMPDGRTVMLAWESNWSYTREANTTPWYGNMTLPRELTLEQNADTTDGYLLANTVIKEIANNEEANVIDQKNSTFSISSTDQKVQYDGKQYKISATFSWDESNKPSSIGFKLRVSDDKKYDMLVGYDLTTGLFFVQRLNTGEPNMGAPRDKMNATVNADGSITITVYVDETSIEAFANNGEKSITQNFFMRPENIGDQATNGVYVYSDNGTTNISNLTINPIASIWNSVGKLTEKFVDESGNSIAADVVSSGNIGDPYSTTQKDIAGYTFKEVQGSPKGSFTAQDQTVTYVYTKNPVAGGKVTGDTGSIQSKNPSVTGNGSEKPSSDQLGNSSQLNNSAKSGIVNTSTSAESQSNNDFNSISRLPKTGEDKNEKETISFVGVLLVIVGNLLGLIGIKKHRSSL